MSERRNAAKRGVIAYTDVLDQPTEKYLLLVDINPMQLLIFQVDQVTTEGETVIGKKSDGSTAVAFSKLYPWYTVSNDLVNLQEYEKIMRARAEDDKVLETLKKEIGPAEIENQFGGLSIGQYA
jgi:hypothetical protein